MSTVKPVAMAPAGAAAPSPGGYEDPYTRWALVTGLRALKRNQGSLAPELTFLVELRQPYSVSSQFSDDGFNDGSMPGARLVKVGGLLLRIPRAFEQPLPHTGQTASFITLRLDSFEGDVAKIAVLIDLLRGLPQVKRLQMGFQRPSLGLPPHQADDLGLGPPDAGPGQAPDGTPVLAVPKVVLGIIEDGCLFSHAALRHGLQSRVVTQWDQSLQDGSPVLPWQLVPGFPYGRTLGQAAMTALLLKHAEAGEVDEEAVLADPLVSVLPLRQRVSHAAAVSDLLAGPAAALGRGLGSDDGAPNVAAAHLAETSPVRSAPVLAVQLPGEQTTVSSGRWLAVNAVDALHFLIGAAAALGDKGVPPPMVVNISYGALASAHDGSSMLESAVDELCLGVHNLAVLVAAGNAHGTLHDTDALHSGATVPGGVHACCTLAPGSQAQFILLAPADKPFETYLELWFSDPSLAALADQHLALDEVEIAVTDPLGRAWPWVPCGGSHLDRDAGGQVVAGLFVQRKPCQSLRRSMALLVLAATRVHGDFVEALAGRWTLRVRHRQNAGARPLVVDAWVERDDSTYGIDRPQSARLLPDTPDSAWPLTDANTLSTLACGERTLAVGALVDHPAGWRASHYSAAGAGATSGPLVSAQADAGLALAGIRVAGRITGMVQRGFGTSLAAPQAARWIAHRMADGEPLQAIIDGLRQTPHRDARRGEKVP